MHLKATNNEKYAHGKCPNSHTSKIKTMDHGYVDRLILEELLFFLETTQNGENRDECYSRLHFYFE